MTFRASAAKSDAKISIRLLLVEDDAIDRLACRRALAQHPVYEFEFLEAETARAGLELVFAERPDCVLLDHHLPDMSGVEFLAALVAEHSMSAPVLMLTGADDVGIAVEAMRQGARDYLLKDGERRYLELVPVVIERVLREQATLNAKQRAEENLRAAEAKFRTLVEQIPAITYISAHDVPGEILYVSPPVSRLGFTAEEWLATGPFPHIHPDDRDRVRTAYVDALNSGERLRCEYRLTARSGEMLWFLDEARLVRDERGEPLFLQGVLVDITEDKQREEELEYHRRRLDELVTRRTEQLEKQTDMLKAANINLGKEIEERRRAERALHISEGSFRLLLESVGEGIYGIDAQGCCTFINVAALNMLGYSREELLGQPMHERLHHSRADGSLYPVQDCPIYDTLRASRDVHTVEMLWRKDGSGFPAEYSAYPLRDNGQSSGAVLVFRDVTEAQATNRQLSWRATHDALTGLVNRHEFEQRLTQLLATNKGEHALCYIDLDQFKEVNDTCGHAGGDELLRGLSALLQEKMRSSDTLARLGGDEFGMLLQQCPRDQALRIANDLREAVRDFRFVWEGKSFTVGASIGVVVLTAAIEDLASALRAADAACYAAKEKGRNRVHVYQSGDNELAERSVRMQWASRLTRALDEDRFELCYQSIASLSGQPAERPYYEILLRLLDEDGQRIEPGAFIPAAKRHNLMPAIDRWVLRHAVANLAAQHRGTPAQVWPIYAVNLSPMSLNDSGLADMIVQLLQEHEVPGTALCIEMAETTVMANLSQVAHLLHRLKQLGCLFSIDNFSGGIPSFAYLRSLPVDFLKIDGDFLRGITEDRVVRVMAEAINQVAHDMSIQTVAECTESDAMLAAVRDLGVDHAQGYAVMRPSPLAELARTKGAH